MPDKIYYPFYDYLQKKLFIKELNIENNVNNFTNRQIKINCGFLKTIKSTKIIESKLKNKTILLVLKGLQHSKNDCI